MNSTEHIAYIHMLIAVWLIFMGTFFNVKNFRSAMLFKLFPALSGVFMIIVALKNLGIL